jgi:plasmid maintenance system antidote protein VapI
VYGALGKWGGSGKGKIAEEYKALKERNDEIERLMQSGSQITPEIVEEARKIAQDMKDETKYEFDLLMDMFGIKFGQNSNLSNLQQGISAITEDTANALEAYMNGVSQQVYAHTELLTEIRDAVIAFNGDVTLGVQSQMLLQLQNNYILMQTMQTLMENWTVPSGNGIRVELMN